MNAHCQQGAAQLISNSCTTLAGWCSGETPNLPPKTAQTSSPLRRSNATCLPVMLQTGAKVTDVSQLQDIDELCVVEVRGTPHPTHLFTQVAVPVAVPVSLQALQGSTSAAAHTRTTPKRHLVAAACWQHGQPAVGCSKPATGCLVSCRLTMCLFRLQRRMQLSGWLSCPAQELDCRVTGSRLLQGRWLTHHPVPHMVLPVAFCTIQAATAQP